MQNMFFFCTIFCIIVFLIKNKSAHIHCTFVKQVLLEKDDHLGCFPCVIRAWDKQGGAEGEWSIVYHS
jgi:hypothetical protein